MGKNNNSIKLIAFDLDGVLVDGRGSWREVHEGLGTAELSEIHAKEFYSGRITFDEWARKDAELWRGVEIEKIKEILYKTKLMKGTSYTLKKLKERGYKIAIISGGLKILADYLREKFNLDYVKANELLVKGGKVCGMRHIIDMEGKGTALENIANEIGFQGKECAAIGDYFNDIPMFKFAGFSIAFNPKVPEIEEIADVVIYEKDLRRILEFF
jgi:phosphoserine phosphatase